MTDKNPHFTHLTLDGDRWDLLAYRYYGEANKQTVLLDANRRLFVNPVVVPPLILPSGLTLIVPVLADDAVADTDLPPWKRPEARYG